MRLHDSLVLANMSFLDLQHHIFYLTLDGKLGFAPPNKPDAKVGRVLDLGTGTGIWAMDFGDEHPEAEVRTQSTLIKFYIRLTCLCCRLSALISHQANPNCEQSLI